MNLFPAIDLISGKAVRLTRGDYAQMTVYGDNPVGVAQNFEKSGATYLHVVDLDGARDGSTANLDTIRQIIAGTGLSVEVGGGIRSEERVKAYLGLGAFRVILGTAALTVPGFAAEMVKKYGDRIAVGVDIRDGRVAVKGWAELTSVDCFDFLHQLERDGVKTVICTDISKDGAQSGTNRALYASMVSECGMEIVASGGVSTIDDIRYLASLHLSGAILGKALYTGALRLEDALAAETGKGKV